jgi:hypothetical protein
MLHGLLIPLVHRLLGYRTIHLELVAAEPAGRSTP